MYLTLAFTKGISSVDLAKSLNVDQKTAWLLVQRIRAMQANGGKLPVAGLTEPMLGKREHEQRRWAIMAIDAREIARLRAAKRPLWPSQKQRLDEMPKDVREELDAIEPERSRYTSSRLYSKRGRGSSRIEMPAHVKGFQRVMAAIAAHASCHPTTLYRRAKELEQKMLQRKSRPKGRYARGDAYDV